RGGGTGNDPRSAPPTKASPEDRSGSRSAAVLGSDLPAVHARSTSQRPGSQRKANVRNGCASFLPFHQHFECFQHFCSGRNETSVGVRVAVDELIVLQFR